MVRQIKRIKAQANVIGVVLIVSIFLIGIFVFYDTVSNKLKKESVKLSLSHIKAKAIEITEALNEVLKYKATKVILWTIKDAQFAVVGFGGNFTILTIITPIKQKFPEEVVKGDLPYREVCFIDKENNNALISCPLEGYTLNNLSSICEKRNNIYYCDYGKMYVEIEDNDNYYLVTPLPSPKLNLYSNNLCSSYLVYFRGKTQIIFVCDYYYDNGVCYFPVFKPGFVAYNAAETTTKVSISYDHSEKMSYNPYPFCKVSYKVFIKLKKS